MKHRPLIILILLPTIWGCLLFAPRSLPQTASPLPPTGSATPSETPHPICTPPLCARNETYFCPGTCLGGCGTTCATVTADLSLFPLTPIPGTGIWLMKQDDQNLVYFDPTGETASYVFQRTPALLADFILTNGEQAFLLSDPGDGTLTVTQFYPREGYVATLPANRNQEGSALWGHPPIFSNDGRTLVWSNPAETGSNTQVLLSTSLETGETRELWRLPLPVEVSGHALLPLYFDESRHLLIYALHTFYSGMTPKQVASLYLAQIDTNQITPLVALNPSGLYAGYSATISKDGKLLAYLTYKGEPDSDFNLNWILHIRNLVTEQENNLLLPTPLSQAEIITFSPNNAAILLSGQQYLSTDGKVDVQHNLMRFDIAEKTFKTIWSAQEAQTPPPTLFEALTWITADWIVLKSNENASTWALRADGSAFVQVTPLEWIGLLEAPLP